MRADRHWTDKEITILLERYATTDTFALAMELGRTKTGVQAKASAMGLRKRGGQRGGVVRHWSEHDLEILRAEYPRTLTDVLARRLGRSVNTVYNKASELGLRKDAALMRPVRKIAAAQGGRARAANAAARPPNAVPQLCKPRPRPAPAAPLPDERAAHVKRLRREAVDTLVAHGLEDHAAELACHLIAKGLVPALKFEMPA